MQTTMTLKSIEARLATIEDRHRRQPQGETPEWWDDVPADLKADAEHMEARVKEAGGLSADTFVLETANRLAWFVSNWNNRRGVAT